MDENGAGDDIEKELLSSLRQQQPQSANCHFTLKAVDNEHRMVGGLTAATSYGWLLVKTLWVRDDCRKAGIGAALLERAEQTGVMHGCHGVWLDTSSDTARDFYLHFGYRDFGVLGNRSGQYPEQHRRWFMQKQLNE